MKKQLILTAVTAGVIALTGVGGAVVSADSSHTTKPTAKSARADRHIRTTAKLNQAVRDGVITSNQKTSFETEVKTLRSEYKSAIHKSSTKTDRQTERTKLKNELKTWASPNNFPLAKIFPKLAS